MVDLPAEPLSARETDLALAMSQKRYGECLTQTKAKAAVLWHGADWETYGLEAAILVERPRLAMAHITQGFDLREARKGVSAKASVSSTAVIGADVFVDAFAAIGEGAQVGDDCQIGSHCSIAAGAKLGRGCVLHPGVRVGRNVVLGDGVILHSNVVIGGDGFSFVTAAVSNEERAFMTLGKTPLSPPEDAKRHRIHSLGGVDIRDDVEIGANSTVDAGTIRATIVGKGTKIDNLVQVGHNVIVGQDCVLCAQTAIAGSSIVGDRSVLGGKSGVKDNVKIGNDVVLGGAAIALNDVPDGRFMMGYPAVEMPEFRSRLRGLKALPDLISKLKRS